MRRTSRWFIAAPLLVAGGTCVGAPPAFHEAVDGDSPLLWYRFDESSGSATAVNYGSLGSSHDGTYFNGVTLETATSSGDTGATFDALQSQYLESGDDAPASVLGNPTFSCEAVVYIPADATVIRYPPFLHWGEGTTGRSVYFGMRGSQPGFMYTGFDDGGLFSPCPFNLDEWNHFVWTRDGDNGNNGQWDGSTLYVNGEVTPLEIDTALIGAPVLDITATRFRVQRAQDFERYFDGVMDEVVLYDRVLGADEVLEHFDALSITPTVCMADFDDTCGVTSDDFFAFIEAYLGGDADINGDGGNEQQRLLRVPRRVLRRVLSQGSRSGSNPSPLNHSFDPSPSATMPRRSSSTTYPSSRSVIECAEASSSPTVTLPCRIEHTT